MNTTIRHIELTLSEIDYLNGAGFLPAPLLESLKDICWCSDVAGTLAVSAARAEDFREAFTEQLAKVGFDETYEPTIDGRLLECLIDRFHTNS